MLTQIGFVSECRRCCSAWLGLLNKWLATDGDFAKGLKLTTHQDAKHEAGGGQASTVTNYRAVTQRASRGKPKGKQHKVKTMQIV